MTTLPPPILVEPGPGCACRGTGLHFREHTAKWCSVLTTDELNALTSNIDPLDVTTRAGYDSGPTRRVVINERPVVDDRGMVIVWIVAALAFVAAMVITILAVAGRPPNG